MHITVELALAEPDEDRIFGPSYHARQAALAEQAAAALRNKTETICGGDRVSEDKMDSLRGVISWSFGFGLTMGTLIHRADVMTPIWWGLNTLFLLTCGIGVIFCYRGVYRA